MFSIRPPFAECPDEFSFMIHHRRRDVSRQGGHSNTPLGSLSFPRRRESILSKFLHLKEIPKGLHVDNPARLAGGRRCNRRDSAPTTIHPRFEMNRKYILHLQYIILQYSAGDGCQPSLRGDTPNGLSHIINSLTADRSAERQMN